MIRLLLDAHIPVAVARRLREDRIDVVALRDWLEGNFRHASDEQVLAAASTEERVLVTYDCHTIPSLLKDWAQMDRHHRGVVLVDEKTLMPNDVGGLARALRALVREQGAQPWEDRAVFLQRSPAERGGHPR